MRDLLHFIPCVAMCLIGCTPPSVTAPPALPAGRILAEAFKPVPSIINVPVEIRTHALEQMINEQLPPLLFESDTMTVGVMKNVKVKVWKGDSIRLSLQGDRLNYRIPIRIWMQFSFSVGAFSVSHTEYQDVEAGIALKFRSRLFVKNDWKAVTMTESDGYDWTTDPVVKVRFVTIPVKPLADFILSRQHKKFGEIVDKGVSSMLDIKKLLHPLWVQIQKPIRLAEYPPLWLRLTPRSVSMTQLAGNGRMITSSVGITSVAETFFGKEPVCTPKDSLPDFVIPGRVDSSFVLNLYSEITYANASELLRSYLQGRSFTSGRKEVIVQDIEIYGLEGYAVVSIDFAGSFKGKVYVIGRTRYDAQKSTISIEELDFDVSTKNALHNTAEWLFHGVIIDKVKPYLSFPLREKMLESQLMVQKMLCNSKLMKNVYVNGFIDSLSIGDVRVTDRALQAVVLSRGSLFLNIRE
ncbi:MAG: DUF4403 family protein [Chitinispirillaceae bacterium]|nr:DUF4403 family protein [Chitinispirillaceae bacterium]